jgi:hypothetical protein
VVHWLTAVMSNATMLASGDASVFSLGDVGSVALLVVGFLLCAVGSLELRPLLLIVEACLTGACLCVRLAACLSSVQGTSSIILWPAYCPAILALATLVVHHRPAAVLLHMLCTSSAAGLLALQFSSLHHIMVTQATIEGIEGVGIATAPIDVPTATILLPMAFALLLPLLGALRRWPRSAYEALAASLVGSQSVAVGGAHFLGCAWLSDLGWLLGVPVPEFLAVEGFTDPTTSTAAAPPSSSVAALLYSSLALAVVGTLAQYLIHACRGSLLEDEVPSRALPHDHPSSSSTRAAISPQRRSAPRGPLGRLLLPFRTMWWSRTRGGQRGWNARST